MKLGLVEELSVVFIINPGEGTQLENRLNMYAVLQRIHIPFVSV